MSLESPGDTLAVQFGAAGAAVLHALIDTLIPPDDWPGGWEAGVADYLARGFGAHLSSYVPTYMACLASLSAEAQINYGRPFAGLEPAERTALLEQLEDEGRTIEWVIPPANFIRIANEHAAEGFYADPGNGGNKDGVAWKMIGFEVAG